MALTASEKLKERIAELEKIRRLQRVEISTAMQGMVESVKPKNLLRAGLQSINETPGLRQNLINAVISLTTGWVASKLAIPKSANSMVKRTVGAAVQYGVTHLLATQGDALGNVVENFVSNLKRHKA